MEARLHTSNPFIHRSSASLPACQKMSSNLASSSTFLFHLLLLFLLTASFCHLGTVSGTVYVDVVSGDEFFSDAHNYKITLLEDVVYEVEGSLVKVKPPPGQVEEDEADEDAAELAPDFVLNHHLAETFFPSKAEYLRYLRNYMEMAVAVASAPVPPEQAELLMTKTEKVMEGLLEESIDLVYYAGVSVSTHGGLIAVGRYKEFDDGERIIPPIPLIYVVKVGLEEKS